MCALLRPTVAPLRQNLHRSAQVPFATVGFVVFRFPKVTSIFEISSLAFQFVWGIECQSNSNFGGDLLVLRPADCHSSLVVLKNSKRFSLVSRTLFCAEVFVSSQACVGRLSASSPQSPAMSSVCTDGFSGQQQPRLTPPNVETFGSNTVTGNASREGCGAWFAQCGHQLCLRG